METIRVSTWAHFIEHLARLKRDRDTTKRQSDTKAVSRLLFRGQGDSAWPLSTTLERDVPELPTVEEYYRSIFPMAAHISTVLERSWTLPTVPRVLNTFNKRGGLNGSSLPAYEYLAYLRHHGFPSPLLDWSESPYVAAFFAFSRAAKRGHVAIYAYLEYAGHAKGTASGSPRISTLGPYVRGHRRHYLQQSWYTVCTVNHANGPRFASHEEVVSRQSLTQDLVWKFEIPVEERTEVLRVFDEFNLNAYSLFHSEESFLETMAMREFLLRRE
jgi:hypothetical protein